ncbi:MAG: YjdF family protein [Chloroflexi bacterium]|nr:YjdF family protein [Chloroflexota bacterium]
MIVQTTHITLTLLFDGAKWVAIFERKDAAGHAVCEVFCGTSEPMLADVYAMVLKEYRTLAFSQPVLDQAAQDNRSEASRQCRLNFKRMQRESRRLVENSDTLVTVREATREDRARQKAAHEAEIKAAREAQADYQYQLKQEKKKVKHRGR